MPRHTVADRWGLYSERDAEGGAIFHNPAKLIERLPKDAELSGDGKWATVYRKIRGETVATAVYVNLGPMEVRRGRVRASG